MADYSVLLSDLGSNLICALKIVSTTLGILRQIFSSGPHVLVRIGADLLFRIASFYVFLQYKDRFLYTISHSSF